VILRRQEEIVVAYHDREVRELLGHEDYIIEPDGEGRSRIFMYLDAEGQPNIQSILSAVTYHESFEPGYLVLKLSVTIEEVQSMLPDVYFVFPESA